MRRGVIGVLARDGTYLLIKRAPGLSNAGCWCFPGGHIEAGETSRQALRRELAEELGIDALPTQRLGTVRVCDLGYLLVVWRVRHLSGRLCPAAAEVAEVRWLTPASVRAITPALPSNERVLEMLEAPASR